MLTNPPCTCTITGPSPEETTFDPNCPYHGDNGSMVSVIPIRPSVLNSERTSMVTRHKSMNFDELAAEIHLWARCKGFYNRERIAVPTTLTGDIEGSVENPSLASEKLMLIVSECSEALAALRNASRKNEAEEIADIVIRCLDYAAWRGISLDTEIREKMERNYARPYLHGKNF